MFHYISLGDMIEYHRLQIIYLEIRQLAMKQGYYGA